MALYIKVSFMTEIDSRVLSAANLEKVGEGLVKQLDNLPVTVQLEGRPLKMTLACKYAKAEQF